MRQNNHSGHCGINPTPLKNKNALLFRQPPPIYWFFKIPPLKSDISVNPKNINVFRP